MSATQTPILQAKRRAWSYGNVDGLSTIFDGFGFLLIAGFFLVALRTHHFVLVLCGYVLFLLLVSSQAAIVKKLKARITYRRTGYVKPPEPDMPSSLISLSISRDPTPEEAEAQSFPQGSKLDVATKILALLLIFSAWISVAMVYGQGTGAGWLIPMAGMHSLGQARKDKLAWIDLSGLFLSGIGLAVLPLERDSRATLLFLTPGIVYTIRGTITLLVYLYRNPVAQAE